MKVKLQRITSALMAVVLAVGMVVIPAPAAAAAVPTVAIAGGKLVVGAIISEATSRVFDFVVDELQSAATEQAFIQDWVTVSTDTSSHYSVTTEALYDAYSRLLDAGVPCTAQYNASGNFVYILCTDNQVGGGRRTPNQFRTPSKSISGKGFAYGGRLMVAYGDTTYTDDEVSARRDQWLPISTATRSKQVSVLTKDSLSDLCVTVNQTDRTCSVRDTYINGKRFYIIIDPSNNIYANADGVPYVAHYEATATDVKYDYIVNEGDTIDNSTTVDNSQVIDMSNGTFNYIDESGKQEFYIDELLYDFSSQSYSADTYNVTYDNDTYNSFNYTWNILYNITNTYVTNIGQTELYEPLELYYALPDGRSSADLTAEEVAGMSFEFADCVNYAKSATDTYLRALYHFDGNTDDSSYFSTQGKFEWLSGASISYMDVGTFDGALYLGPESHSFKITLPSNIGSGDFSLQFRYYQAGEADTQSNIENSLSIGGTAVLKWDEASLYNGSGTSLTSLAIGSWQEMAVIRHSGTLYLYHNGICIGSSTNTSAWSGEIILTLGATTRAYSMLDELRVVNFAVAESGIAYTCTSVPYDTNVVLVLPDSAFPIADEYWNITSSKTNFLGYSLDEFTSAVKSSYFGSSATAPKWVAGYGNYCTIEAYDGYTRLSSSYTSASPDSFYVGYNDYSYPNVGAYTTVVKTNRASDTPNSGSLLSTKRNYCFSLLLADGTVCSLSFYLAYGTKYETMATFDWGYLVYSNDVDSNYEYNYHKIHIIPAVGKSVDIMYMELVEGTSSDLSAEWVSCMYSSEEVKPNTAAIQTDIPINGYTVGGVRPTFPVRGDVWMPVSNNRISACYVYNGSAWEQVNARWYTGTRWIPIYGFDLTTLEDCWDIADIDETVTLIGTENEFWNWWKEAWTDFRLWLKDNGTGSGSGSGIASGSLKETVSDALSSLIDGIFGAITEVLKSLIGAAGDLLSGISVFLTDTVFGGIKDFFSSISDGSIFEGFQQTDEEGNTTTALPDGIGTVFAFFSGLFGVMPGELRMIMIFGMAMLLLLAVFKMIKT